MSKTSKVLSTGGHFHLILYDPQFQPDTYAKSDGAKNCASDPLRTSRTANCVASRFASAHRQLIIVTMTFIDYLASVTFYQGRIALLLVCQIFYEKWQRELASRSLSSSRGERVDNRSSAR